MRGLAPQWPPAHTYTLGQGRGNVANDRVLVWGELTTSAGLSGPLLTDHTGECLPRAHDFQFFHWKRLLGKGGQEARDNHLCFSTILSILQLCISSAFFLASHLAVHLPPPQPIYHLSTCPSFLLTIYQVTIQQASKRRQNVPSQPSTSSSVLLHLHLSFRLLNHLTISMSTLLSVHPSTTPSIISPN